MSVSRQLLSINCFSSFFFGHSLTSPSPIHSAKSESIITQSEEKADFVIIPSEGIENRTGTVAQPASVGLRNSSQLDECGGPDCLRVSSLTFSPHSLSMQGPLSRVVMLWSQ